MKSLQSRLSSSDLNIIANNVTLMFDDPKNFVTPEALVIYTHSMMTEDELMECVELEYGIELETPPIRYISKEILDHYKGTDCIPYHLDTVRQEIHVILLPELISSRVPTYKGYQVVRHKVPIHYYVEVHREFYGEPRFLKELPSKDIYDIIVSEGVRLKAADITIASRKDTGVVYYNVRKKRLDSKLKLSKQNVEDIANIIASGDNKTRTEANTDPIYPSVDLDANHRGRVNIANNYYGPYISIRVLPNKLFDTTLEELNLLKSVRDFVREKFMDSKKGLRVMVGPPYSGKNTTMISGLHEKIKYAEYKTVSLESPVELIVEHMEQNNLETEESFQLAANSIIRQNPDIIYVTEMTATTAKPTMEMANTGRETYSSIHANSIADLIPRIQDLTDLPLDRIILNLHSAIFQELVRDEETDTVNPVNTYLEFTTELKDRLVGKTLGEIVKIVREEEAKCLLY